MILLSVIVWVVAYHEKLDSSGRQCLIISAAAWSDFCGYCMVSGTVPKRQTRIIAVALCFRFSSTFFFFGNEKVRKSRKESGGPRLYLSITYLPTYLGTYSCRYLGTQMLLEKLAKNPTENTLSKKRTRQNQQHTSHHGIQLRRTSSPSRRPPHPLPNNLHTRAISKNARST